jgi:hypothetical protein
MASSFHTPFTKALTCRFLIESFGVLCVRFHEGRRHAVLRATVVKGGLSAEDKYIRICSKETRVFVHMELQGGELQACADTRIYGHTRVHVFFASIMRGSNIALQNYETSRTFLIVVICHGDMYVCVYVRMCAFIYTHFWNIHRRDVARLSEETLTRMDLRYRRDRAAIPKTLA